MVFKPHTIEPTFEVALFYPYNHQCIESDNERKHYEKKYTILHIFKIWVQSHLYTTKIWSSEFKNLLLDIFMGNNY